MRYAVTTALALIMVLSGIGCATNGGTSGGGLEVIGLTLTASGTILLDGKAVAPERLPSKLKSLGATADTLISFSIPADTPPVQLKPLVSRLVSAGFPKVVFKGPRHAAASVLQPSVPAAQGRTPLP